MIDIGIRQVLVWMMLCFLVICVYFLQRAVLFVLSTARMMHMLMFYAVDMPSYTLVRRWGKKT